MIVPFLMTQFNAYAPLCPVRVLIVTPCFVLGPEHKEAYSLFVQTVTQKPQTFL